MDSKQRVLVVNLSDVAEIGSNKDLSNFDKGQIFMAGGLG